MLRDRLVKQIVAGGPIPFEAFMRACLLDPEGGFFTAGPLRSEEAGDFLTSPEVSPMFGDTLARFVDDRAARTGADPVAVVDAGAGSGSLLRPLLDSLETAADPWAIEVSPAAVERLARNVPEAGIVGSLAELPGPITGVVAANELLDNLPAALAVRGRRGWQERWVGSRGGDLVFTSVEAREPVAAWAEAFGGPVAEGEVVEVQLEASRWVEEAVNRVAAGALVVFDYGNTAEGLRPRRAEGTVRTYRSHHLGPDPLLEPGATDITMDVNFTAAEAAAGSAGGRVEVLTQAEFLERWGLRERVRELRHRELELARSGAVTERLEVRSRLTGAETLLHPRGLGDFRVLVAEVG